MGEKVGIHSHRVQQVIFVVIVVAADVDDDTDVFLLIFIEWVDVMR